jgi:hypothetical protein
VYQRARAIAIGPHPLRREVAAVESFEAEKQTSPQHKEPPPSSRSEQPQPPKAPSLFNFAEGGAFDRAASEWTRRGFSRVQLMQAVGKAHEHLRGSSFDKAPEQWFADYFEYAARASDNYGPAVFNRLGVASSSNRVFAWFESRAARARELRHEQERSARQPAQTETQFIPSAADFQAVLRVLNR